MSNMFTMIMTLLVIGVLVLVAARFGSGLFDDKCMSEYLIQRSTILDTIRTSNDFGSVRQQRFASACHQRELCFIDPRAISGEVSYRQAQTGGSYWLMQSSVEQGVQANIFTFDRDNIMVELGYAHTLRLDDPSQPLCIPARAGTFDVTLRGQARTTLVQSS